MVLRGKKQNGFDFDFAMRKPARSEGVPNDERRPYCVRASAKNTVTDLKKRSRAKTFRSTPFPLTAKPQTNYQRLPSVGVATKSTFIASSVIETTCVGTLKM